MWARRGLVLLWFALALVQTHRYAMVWAHNAGLWAYAAHIAPEKPRVLNNAGAFLAAQRDYVGADALFRRAAVGARHPRRYAWDQQDGTAAATKNLQVLARVQAVALVQALLSPPVPRRAP